VFQSLGRTDEWQHTLDAAVTSITLCDHQTVHDTLRDDMHDNGYLGWSGQQRLLSQGVDDGFDAGNLDAPGQQEDVFLGGAAGSGILLAQSARHDLRRDGAWHVDGQSAAALASGLLDTMAAENPELLAAQNVAGSGLASGSGGESHVDLTTPGDGSNAGVNESNATVVEPAQRDETGRMIDDQNAEYAAGLAADLARAEVGTTATIIPRMGDGSMPGLQPSLASQIADGRSAVPAADRHEIERQRRRSVATDTLMVAATRTAETDAARELAVTTRRAAGAAALRRAASGAAPPQA